MATRKTTATLNLQAVWETVKTHIREHTAKTGHKGIHHPYGGIGQKLSATYGFDKIATRAFLDGCEDNGLLVKGHARSGGVTYYLPENAPAARSVAASNGKPTVTAEMVTAAFSRIAKK